MLLIWSELDLYLFCIKEEEILAHLAQRLDYRQQRQEKVVSLPPRAALFPFFTVPGQDLGFKLAPV
jgi:hypothetical protein